MEDSCSTGTEFSCYTQIILSAISLYSILLKCKISNYDKFSGFDEFSCPILTLRPISLIEEDARLSSIPLTR